MDYDININISRETDDGVGFAATEETERTLSVEADLDEKTIEVEKEPTENIENAVESFLESLGVDEIDLD